MRMPVLIFFLKTSPDNRSDNKLADSNHAGDTALLGEDPDRFPVILDRRNKRVCLFWRPLQPQSVKC